ncbi:MAG: GFA family protein [Rubrivivax sp.]
MTDPIADVEHDDAAPLDGGCSCRRVRYRLHAPPMFVHCCHCRWCQRESGSAFALNALIETDRIERLGATPETVHTPSASGRGQQIVRCPECRVAVWSHYAGAGTAAAFVRVGTLDAPERLPPDIHIFTDSKLPWVTLPAGTPTVAEFYEREHHWPAASLARRAALQATTARAASPNAQPPSDAEHR